ncbi:hypothetical protein HHI36_001781 [Cryptolaemus montrouzieri]|uniref:Uncharacterized protein n=1 Tax=Cryptolaemus montrouzieri TaxID=559131 RepID=A0ABD2P992_9CUCU
MCHLFRKQVLPILNHNLPPARQRLIGIKRISCHLLIFLYGCFFAPKRYCYRNWRTFHLSGWIQSEPNAYLPITPEVIRLYPTAVRNRKTIKGRKPGKSCVHTDTSVCTELKKRHRQKELKKIEQKRRARAKIVKCILKELNSRHKKIESDEDTEKSALWQFILWESTIYLVD